MADITNAERYEAPRIEQRTDLSGALMPPILVSGNADTVVSAAFRPL